MDLTAVEQTAVARTGKLQASVLSGLELAPAGARDVAA